jgi:hypothetical protein
MILDEEQTVVETVYVDLSSLESRLDGVVEQMLQLNGRVSDLTDQAGQLHEQMKHVSGQLDLLHQTVYVGNEYGLFMTVCLALIAACAMFLVGRAVVRRG